MPKATKESGKLIPIDDCYIKINNTTIVMDNLPDISDTKSANYPDEAAIGRSFPFKHYSHSENRAISWGCHFFVQSAGDENKIIDTLRLLESCTYPMTQNTGGAPYSPPPICKIKCGRLLAEKELCAVLKSYSVKFDTTLPWSKNGLVPHRLDVELQFEVVYNQSDLPGSELIMKTGG